MIAFGGARDRSDKHTNGWKRNNYVFCVRLRFLSWNDVFPAQICPWRFFCNVGFSRYIYIYPKYIPLYKHIYTYTLYIYNIYILIFHPMIYPIKYVWCLYFPLPQAINKQDIWAWAVSPLQRPQVLWQMKGASAMEFPMTWRWWWWTHGGIATLRNIVTTNMYE